MTSRKEQILSTAAELFARNGFHGVSVNEIGAAVGISGPALYRHFASKDAMLAEMLVGISHELLDTGLAKAGAAQSPQQALSALVDWHIEFALHNKALIVIQDRDWGALPHDARNQVRTLQRAYVDLWATHLRAVAPGIADDTAHAMVHAAFGLLNSTPRSARVDDDQMADLLHRMALAGLGIDNAE